MKRVSGDSYEDFYDDVEEDCKAVGSPTQSCLQPDRRKRRGQIEKKRRDRINYSLLELKRLVPAAFEKQSSTKLEKAEILKMTVDHLKQLQSSSNARHHHDSATSAASDYKQQGFEECISETLRYLVACEGLDPQNPFCIRLLAHLRNSSGQRRHKGGKNNFQEKAALQPALNYWNQKSLLNGPRFDDSLPYSKALTASSLACLSSGSAFIGTTQYAGFNAASKEASKSMNQFEFISSDAVSSNNQNSDNKNVNSGNNSSGTNNNGNNNNINSNNNSGGRRNDNIIQALHNAHENLHNPFLNIFVETNSNQGIKPSINNNNNNNTLSYNNNSQPSNNLFHNNNNNNQDHLLHNNYNGYHFFPPPPPSVPFTPSSSSSLFSYLKPYRPWGAELALY